MRNTVAAELTLGCQATELHPFFAIIITTVITVMIITTLSFCLTSLLVLRGGLKILKRPQSTDAYQGNSPTVPHLNLIRKLTLKEGTTRMWANAQPDGRPAEHRWRPLFNAPKFG